LLEKALTKNRSSLFLVVFLLLALSVPSRAFAYGDPSGGFLFQTLTPLVALLWGTWLIFAGGVRKRLVKIVRRIRFNKQNAAGGDNCESTSENTSDRN